MLHVFWARRVLVSAAVLILVFAALAFSMFQERVYRAEAVISVVPRDEVSSGPEAETVVEGVFRAVDNQELRLEVMSEAGWQGGEARFEQRREVQTFSRQNGGEAGLLVSFSAPDAEEAARASNAYATLFAERVAQLDERIAGGSVAATAEVQSRAAAPERPSSPRPLLYALVAAAAGLLAGGALALVLESRTQSWRGARDAELTLRAPVLGVIPDYSPEEGEV